MNSDEFLKPEQTAQNSKSTLEEPISVNKVKRYHKLTPQQIIKEKKLDRKQLNMTQRRGYTKSLVKFSTRDQQQQGVGNQPEEIKLLELSKMIIESGWIVEEVVM